MCCISMSTQTNGTGKIMSRERFIKTAQNKKTLNKRKPEPCMRIEALLEATLNRIRVESKQQRLKEEEDEDDEITVRSLEPNSKRQKIEIFECEDNYDYEDELSITESCFDEYTMISAKELSSRTTPLWDDPEQVEDFLNKVSKTSDDNNNTNSSGCVDIKNNNNTNSTKFQEKINQSSESDCSAATIDFDDGFLESMGDTSSELSTLVSNCDSFMIEFDDNLYIKELIRNIINVESYMKSSQSACE